MPEIVVYAVGNRPAEQKARALQGHHRRHGER